jgi:hypothetical protein
LASALDESEGLEGGAERREAGDLNTNSYSNTFAVVASDGG